MADGDILTLDSAQTGGSGTIKGEDKFKWAPPATQVVVTSPWDAFKPHLVYIPAGVSRDAGQNDDTAYGEGSNPTQQFTTYVFAYPEVAPFTGTIDRLAAYLSGGGTPKFWISIARETADANGNSYPGALTSIFAYTHSTGFDGNKLREGTVSISVTKGERFWVCFQSDGTQPCSGLRPSTSYRNVFGNSAPALLSNLPRGLIGWTSATAVSYNAAMSSFPSGGAMMAMGSQPFGNGGANTINRPSVYFRYA